MVEINCSILKNTSEFIAWGQLNRAARGGYVLARIHNPPSREARENARKCIESEDNK